MSTTTFRSGGRRVPIEMFDPAVPARGGAIVIVHGTDGLADNEHGQCPTMMRRYAADLAQKGFTALSPHVQIHHGQGDLLVPFELNAPQIELALRAGGVSSAVFPYTGAGHGFVEDDPANMKARIESRARTLTFFQEHL